MLRINSKAPLLKLNSTDGKIYSLKHSLGKYIVLYFTLKTTLQDAQLRLMILTNYYLNLKN